MLLGLARDRASRRRREERRGRTALARKYEPTAISLDVFLPDMLGWTVLNQLKHDPATRHIPVQILTVEEERQYGLERGAFSFMNKPRTTEGLGGAFDRIKKFAAPRMRELLVVEDDPAEQMSIAELIGHDDVQITAVGSGARSAAADARAVSSTASCSICACPTCPGFDLLSEMQQDADAARHADRRVHGPRAVRIRRGRNCARKAKSIVLKGVRSPERLLDETALFLHRVVTELPPSKQRMIEKLHESDEPLHGRKVLVVDDDIRNIFALNSLLERHRHGGHQRQQRPGGDQAGRGRPTISRSC